MRGRSENSRTADGGGSAQKPGTITCAWMSTTTGAPTIADTPGPPNELGLLLLGERGVRLLPHARVDHVLPGQVRAGGNDAELDVEPDRAGEPLHGQTGRLVGPPVDAEVVLQRRLRDVDAVPGDRRDLRRLARVAEHPLRGGDVALYQVHEVVVVRLHVRLRRHQHVVVLVRIDVLQLGDDPDLLAGRLDLRDLVDVVDVHLQLTRDLRIHACRAREVDGLDVVDRQLALADHRDQGVVASAADGVDADRLALEVATRLDRWIARADLPVAAVHHFPHDGGRMTT